MLIFTTYYVNSLWGWSAHRGRVSLCQKLEHRKWFPRPLCWRFFFFSSLLFFSFSFLFSSLVTWKCKMFLLSLVLRSLKGKSNQTSILLADSLCGRCLLKQSDTVTDRQRVPLGGATEDRPSQFSTQHNSSWFLLNSLCLDNAKKILIMYHLFPPPLSFFFSFFF